MGAEGFIASRLSFKGGLVTAGIAVSFVIIIVAVFIASGFRNEIRNAVSDICADVQLPADADTAGISSISGVKSIRPVSYKSGIARRESDINGVVIKGIPSEELSGLKVRIPRRLSDMLGYESGDRMLVYFVSDNVQIRNFLVDEVYDNPVEVEGLQLIYASLEDIRRLDSANSREEYEIRLDDRFSTAEAMRGKALEISIHSGAQASVSCDRYPNLFEWLGLIDANVMAILVLMSVVAGFNMISSLLILLFRSIRTIGTLKAVGMTDKSISKVFLRLASKLVLKGMLIGNVVATGLCFIQKYTHVIKLNPENYFVSFVPVDFSVSWIIMADIFAFAVILLLELIPTLFISRVDPSLTVKAD